MRILVVEDDAAIARVIARGLEQAGYEVDAVADGILGLNAALERSYSLVVLDLMLPGMNGWQLCERLRAGRTQTPILMLTALGGVDDRVKGLDAGADDYLAKPFEMKELLARIRALLRRDRVHRTRLIKVADLEIDIAQRRVTRTGVEIGLSRREFDLLEALASHEGQVLTREVIQERVWMDDSSYSNTVDVYIGFLRRKVDAGHEVKLIQTVRGLGYSLHAPRGGDRT